MSNSEPEHSSDLLQDPSQLVAEGELHNSLSDLCLDRDPVTPSIKSCFYNLGNYSKLLFKKHLKIFIINIIFQSDAD